MYLTTDTLKSLIELKKSLQADIIKKQVDIQLIDETIRKHTIPHAEIVNPDILTLLLQPN